MQLVYGGLTVLIIVFANIHGTIAMGRRNYTSIECASVKDLTFKLSNRNNKSVTIAECYFKSQSCHILTKTLSNKYEVVHTGRGGLLKIIITDEDTIGTYGCYETYNNMNFISTNISKSPLFSSVDNSYSDTHKQTEDAVFSGSFNDVHGIPVSSRLRDPCSDERCGHIVLGTVKNTSIECSSNVDLTFKFTGNKSNKSVTIAECYLMVTSCNILNPSLRGQYSLFFTGIGGVLRINSVDDESIGIYKCLETHNPDNFVSFDIISYDTDAVDSTTNHVTTVTQNTTENHSDEIEKNKATALTVTFAGILAGLMIVFVFFLAWRRCQAARRRNRHTGYYSKDMGSLTTSEIPEFRILKFRIRSGSMEC